MSRKPTRDAAEDLERLRGTKARSSGSSRSSGGGVRKSSVDLDKYLGGGDSGGGGGKSLFGQVGSVFSSLPAGIAGLGGQAWDSTVGNIGATVYSGLGYSPEEVRDRGVFARLLANEDLMESARRGDSFGSQLKAALPLYNEVGQSVSGTIGRVTDQAAALAPGGKAAGEGAYAQAVRDSEIVPVLLEDVGNAALVGAVGGQAVAGAGRASAASAAGASPVSALRAAGQTRQGLPVAGRIPQAAERVAQGGRIVDEGLGKALFSPLTVPGRAVARTERFRNWRDTGITPRFADSRLLTARTRPLRDIVSQERRIAQRQVGEVAEASQEALKIAESPVESVAAHLRAGGVADAVGSLGQLPEDVRAAVFSSLLDQPQVRGILSDLSETQAAEAFDLAVRSVTDPTSVPEPQLRRLDRIEEVWEAPSRIAAENYRSQRGRLEPLPDELVERRMGDVLLTDEVRRVEESYTSDRAKITDEIERSGAGEIDALHARLADLDERMAADVAAARESIMSAPAKYRIPLVAARAARDALAEMRDAVDIDSALIDEVEAGLVTSTVQAIDRLDPTFLQSGRLPGVRGGRPPMVTKTKAEHAKGGSFGSLTSGGQAVMLATEIERLTRNEIGKRILAEFGRRAEDLDDVTGWRPVDPRRPFAPIKDFEVTPDTVYLPDWATDAVEYQFSKSGTGEEWAQKFVDAPTRVWKHSVLALSPRWHMGNVVGNMLMAWASGIGPARQLELMREARRMIVDGDMPDEFVNSGSAAEHAQILAAHGEMAASGGPIDPRQARQLRSGGNRVQRGARKAASRLVDPESRLGHSLDAALSPIQSSYRFNGFVDDLFHNIVYLDEMKRGADPDAAVKQALKVAGDFSNLSRFERTVARRALPFYSWLRHITKLSADLAVNHPLRSAWTLHLWSLFAPEEDYSDIPSLFGSIPVGDDEFVRARSYMPFGTVLDLDPSDPVGTVASSASPMIKVPLESLTGIEAGLGGLQPLSRPPGEGRTDGYGNPVLGPIGLGATANRLAQVTPQTRVLQQLWPGRERVVRFDTGEPVTVRSRFGGRVPIPDENLQSTRGVVARNLLGLPLPVRTNVDAIRARREDRSD